MSADTLANVERIEPAPVEGEFVKGYWPGGAVALVEHWRQRALGAERELAELRRIARHWRRDQ